MTDSQYLDVALDLIVAREEDDDYICTALHDIPKERKICMRDCNNLDRICVLRYLKVLWKEKKKTNTSTHSA